jgi:hypothetical protein
VGQAPGWYDDLFARDQERYWDGRLWTSHTRPFGSDDPGPFADIVEDDPFAAVSLEAGVSPAKVRRGGGRGGAAYAVAAAVLIAAVLGGAGYYVLGRHSEAAATEAVTTAATQSLDAKSADMLFSMNLSGPGLSEQVTGMGAFDFADQTATMTVNLPLGHSEQLILDAGTVYLNLGNLVGQVAPGKTWISATESQLSSGNDSGLGGGGSISQWDDPAGALEQLQAAGATVTSDGPTTYGGTPVTEYSVTLPSSAFSKYLGSLPSSLQQVASGLSMPNLTEKVYVESGNLLRAVDMPYSFGVMGKTFSMDIQMSLVNYGTTVTVTPPPPSEVLPYNDFSGNSGNTGNSGDLGNSGNTGDTGNAANTGSGTI